MDKVSAFAVYSNHKSKNRKILSAKSKAIKKPHKILNTDKFASKILDLDIITVTNAKTPKTHKISPRNAITSNNTKTKKLKKKSITSSLIKSTVEDINDETTIPQLVQPRKSLKVKKSKILKQIDSNNVEPLQLIGAKIHRKLKKHGNSVTATINEVQSVEVKTTKKSAKKYRKNDVLTNLKPSICDVEENPFSVAQNLLSFLLLPVKLDNFFENYWETRPLHLKRQNPNFFNKLLTSEKLDKMLRENPLYYTRNVDVVTYENGERKTHNPEGRAKPASVWDYYSNGCSVRILNPHTYCPKIRLLLATLQEYFGTMVGVNVYLTPAGSQGFAPHYDDIEAFVLQLEGRKHWKIYSPKSESDVLPRYSSPNLSRDELGSPLMELTVEAGDSLYFPRGFVHEASTDEDAHSLHLTVSVYQNTAYVDLLERLLPEALRLAARDDIEYRRGLPLHYLKKLGAVNAEKNDADRETILNNVNQLISKLVNYAPVDWATDQMGRKFMREALPPVLNSSEKHRSSSYDGDFLVKGRIQNRAEFGLDTMVRLVRYHSLRLSVENENTAKLYYCTENAYVYHGEEEQSLEIDVGLLDVIRALIDKYPDYISVENLPCANEVDKINVISDLWEKGLLVTRESLEIVDE